jgi:hypothetical protein
MKDFEAIAGCHSSKCTWWKILRLLLTAIVQSVHMMKDFAAIAHCHSSKCTWWHFVAILPIVVNICKAVGQKFIVLNRCCLQNRIYGEFHFWVGLSVFEQGLLFLSRIFHFLSKILPFLPCNASTFYME